MKILCYGSLNVDYTYEVDHFVKKGETLSSQKLSIFAGGKGLNQSIALARTGVEVYHAGAVGQDGSFLINILNEAGVHTEFVKVLNDVKTGHAIIQNDLAGDNCILLYGGANHALCRKDIDDVIEQFERGDYMLLQNEINELAYTVEKAHQKGMRIVLNPSPMNETIFELPLDKIDYLILNEVEASQILKRKGNKSIGYEEILEELSTIFPHSVVVLTLGCEGSFLKSAKETVFQPAYKVNTVDTTAAGDTFTGYFVGAVISGLSHKDAMERATRAAAIAVSRPGASSSIPYITEVMGEHFEPIYREEYPKWKQCD